MEIDDLFWAQYGGSSIFIFKSGHKIIDARSLDFQSNYPISTLLLEPFYIDPEGSELVAFVLFNDINEDDMNEDEDDVNEDNTNEVKIIIYQKDRNNVMQLVFPINELDLTGFRVNNIHFLKYHDVNLKELDIITKSKLIFNANLYRNRNIDDVFLAAIMNDIRISPM